MITQFLYRLHPFMFGIQLLGIASSFWAFMFLAIFGGAFDLIGDFPGFYETCIILPFAFPLTLVTYVNYPKLKNRNLALWLLISTLILNAILAIQVILVLYRLLGWFIKYFY